MDSVALAGADADQFSVESEDCTTEPIAPQEGCEIELAFSPTSTGGKTANLRLASDAPGSPHAAALSGAGTSPAVEVQPESLTFGNQRVDTTSEPHSLTVTNTGDANLAVEGVDLEGADADQFSIESEDCAGETVAPQEECSVDLTFSPTSTGEKTATLNLVSDAPNSPHAATLSGAGTLPAVELDRQSVGFGDQRVGTDSDPETITLTNTGTASLSVSGVNLEGEDEDQFAFVSEDCTASPVEPQEKCVVELTFGPASTGDKSATLSFASDAPGSPHTAALSGTGTLPGVSLDPNVVDFGGLTVGTGSDPREVALTNTGNGPLEVSSVQLAGPESDQFSVASDGCGSEVVLPQQGCVVEVSFEPDSPGAKRAILSFESDAPGGPHEVALSGEGIVFGTTLTLDSTRNLILLGGSAGLSGRLVDENGKVLANREIVLERRFLDQQRFQQIGTLTTNADGAFSSRISPPRNAFFRASFAGDRQNNPSTSSARVNVRTLVNLRLSRANVPAGQKLVVAGNVRPAKTSFVVLTIRRGGQVVVNRRLNLNNQGRYRFAYRVPAGGNYVAQVRYAGDRDNLGNASSRRFKATLPPRGVGQNQSANIPTGGRVQQRNRAAGGR